MYFHKGMKFTEQIQFPFSEPFTECAISPRIFTNEWKLNTYRKLLERIQMTI